MALVFLYIFCSFFSFPSSFHVRRFIANLGLPPSRPEPSCPLGHLAFSLALWPRRCGTTRSFVNRTYSQQNTSHLEVWARKKHANSRTKRKTALVPTRDREKGITDFHRHVEASLLRPFSLKTDFCVYFLSCETRLCKKRHQTPRRARHDRKRDRDRKCGPKRTIWRSLRSATRNLTVEGAMPQGVLAAMALMAIHVRYTFYSKESQGRDEGREREPHEPSPYVQADSYVIDGSFTSSHCEFLTRRSS